MGRPRKYNDAELERIARRLERGEPPGAIAREMGISRQRVTQLARQTDPAYRERERRRAKRVYRERRDFNLSQKEQAHE